MTKAIKIEKLIVHAGIFHADDALCAAMARVLNPDAVIVRSFRVPEDYDDQTAETTGIYAADIGGGRFDHHQPDARRRESGEKFAACGLLYDLWQDALFQTPVARSRFLRDFILPVELQDNNGKGKGFGTPLSVMIKNLNPLWDEAQDFDRAFFKAVGLFEALIKREQAREASALRAKDAVAKALTESEDGVVVLPQSMPWQAVLIEPDTPALFCVYPSSRGGWNLQTVAVSPEERTPRREIPEDWLAHRPEGCTFVHAGRFLASFVSKDAAVKAATALCRADEDDLKL